MLRSPSSVLFACTANSVRSPMAECLLKHHLGRSVYVDSVGVRTRPIDTFAVAVMAERGLELAGHRSKSFDDLEDTSFDLVISLSPEAQHRAVELTRTHACEILFWPIFDPTIVEGTREDRLVAYRGVRDDLTRRIHAAFPQTRPLDV